MKKTCEERRYFILCKFLDTGKMWIYGTGRTRVTNLDRGYVNFRNACNSCDLIYAKRIAYGDNVACSVVALDV